MGRDSHQPYMYDPPARYSVVSTENKDFVKEFDPKAVTRASWQGPQKKKKPSGPLINQINRHPDSYVQVPYGNINKKPMSLKVKDWVKWTRIFQLFLRVLEFVGAAGLLVCVITIRGTQISEGWIIRVPAAVDILVTLYAIYHLARPAKGRPPTSSASYHFFALILDAGLIPFYIFTALMAHMHYDEKRGTPGRWKTLFKTPDDTNKILTTTWLVSITVGGMHIVSLLIDLYLVIIFRKISQMPPDMSPLDVSKKKSKKHKHKNSSITVTSAVTVESDEKRFSGLSGTTNGSYATLPNPKSVRNSQREPLLPHQHPASRPTSFYQTRNDSSTAFSPHNPTTARLSRADLPSQLQQHNSSRTSVDLQRAGPRSRGNTMSSQAQNPRRRTLTDSPHTFIAHDDGLSRSPERSPKRASRAEIDVKRRSQHEQQLQNDNWFVIGTEEDDIDSGSGDLAEVYQREIFSTVSAVTPSTISTNSYMDSRPTSLAGPLQPLAMNPPVSNNPARHSTPARIDSYLPSRSGTRGRYYGDLKAAVHGVRATPPPSTPPPAQPKEGNWASYSAGRGERTHDRYGREVRENSPRVVSRSGADVDAGVDLGLLSGERRRDVSGKAAEEGRGGPGGWWHGAPGLVQRKVSGVS